jgi:HlyD family secretion protein
MTGRREEQSIRRIKAVEESAGPQGAALIFELRRLQDVLERERRVRRERHARVPAGAPAPHPHGRMKGHPAPIGGSGLVRLFGIFGSRGRRPPESKAKDAPTAPSFTASGTGTDGNVLFHSWPGRGERAGPQPAGVRQDVKPRPRRGSLLARLLTAVRPREKFGSLLSAARKNTPELMPAGGAFQWLRSFYDFLTSATANDGPESRLNVRLVRAFEGELKVGLRVLIIGAGILGGWAIFVPLSGAVVVPGTLVSESDVKKIQHPTGGVVADIAVHDGMHVHSGDLLLHLDETQLRANAQVVGQQLDQTRARLARLIAERDGLAQPVMPHELAGRPGDDAVTRLWASEISLFKSRAAARRSAKDLLRNHVGQLGEQIGGLEAQVKSKSAQHDLIAGELEGVDSLYQKGLVPLARKTALQREGARLDGDRGQAAAAIAEAKSKISEAELQAIRIDEDFRTEVMKDLRETQDREAELIEKSIAARDMLKRVDLRAPTDGIVHQLSVHTIGGVIVPGEVVMEIVPGSDELQIEAKLPPRDVDHVHAGQRTYVRFSAFNQRTTPELDGVVSYVSADLSRDSQNSNAGYYTVRVTLPSAERRRLGNLKLVSGMPAEVFLQTGRRTMMSYLLKPISDQLLRTFN